MERQEYFKNALSDFAFDMASGGAIRHLADQGYTLEEISKKLDFPTPYARIQQTVRKHFLDTGVLLPEEPGAGKKQETYAYVTEYDRYGRKSFRQVAAAFGGGEPIEWKSRLFCKAFDGQLLDFLTKRCAGNGEASAYVSCDFGLRSKREPKRYEKALAALEKRQRDYVMGIFCEQRMAYHRLDRRMREIVSALYKCGEYQGCCYFTELKEKIEIKSE